MNCNHTSLQANEFPLHRRAGLMMQEPHFMMRLYTPGYTDTCVVELLIAAGG